MVKRNDEVILPGAYIGILGDGQLGRMLAMAANRMGYKVAVLGPGGRDSPTGDVCRWAKAWAPDGSVSDELLDEFCGLVSVVIIEWENVPVELVERIEARGVPVRSGATALHIAQDRLYEKTCAQQLKIPVPRFVHLDYLGAELELRGSGQSLKSWPYPTILKTRRNGYDGRNQVRIPAGVPIAEAWSKLGYVPCILEEQVELKGEISVIVARVPGNPERLAFYGPFVNQHINGILSTTTLNSNSEFAVFTEEAFEATRLLARHLDIHGLLAVEFFIGPQGLLFNELAPRPHNTGHGTLEWCATDQFEQYIRAACNLPLGPTTCLFEGTMTNLIGTLPDNLPELLATPGTVVHLYGKEPRPDRKLGHFTTRANRP